MIWQACDKMFFMCVFSKGLDQIGCFHFIFNCVIFISECNGFRCKVFLKSNTYSCVFFFSLFSVAATKNIS